MLFNHIRLNRHIDIIIITFTYIIMHCLLPLINPCWHGPPLVALKAATAQFPPASSVMKFPIALMSRLTQSVHLCFGLPLFLLPCFTIASVCCPTSLSRLSSYKSKSPRSSFPAPLCDVSTTCPCTLGPTSSLSLPVSSRKN